MTTRVAINSIEAEAPLATSLWAEGVDPIHARGAVLADQARTDLAARGFRSLLVSGDPETPELVRPATRAIVVAALMQVLAILDVDPPITRVPATILAEAAHDLAAACDALLADGDGRRSLETPSPTPLDAHARRSHDAINGAAIAIFVGRQLGLPDTILRDLAHGMLLRDCAQAPAAVRSGALLPGDRDAVEQHAQNAFAVLQGLNWGNAAVRLVVQQHHER